MGNNEEPNIDSLIAEVAVRKGDAQKAQVEYEEALQKKIEADEAFETADLALRKAVLARIEKLTPKVNA